MSSTAPAFALAGVPRVNLMPPLEIERRKRGSLVRVWAWVVVAAMLVAALVVAGAFALKFVAEQALVAEQARDHRPAHRAREPLGCQQRHRDGGRAHRLPRRCDGRRLRVGARRRDGRRRAARTMCVLTGFDLTAGGIPQTDDPTHEVGLTGTMTLESPTPIDLPATIRQLRALESVAAVDGRALSTRQQSVGTYSYQLEIAFDQSIYSGAVRRDGRSRVMSRSIINILGVVVDARRPRARHPARRDAARLPGARGRRADRDRPGHERDRTRRRSTALREEEEHLDETQASVADLQTQITPANELDDVFEVIAKAAEATGVTITSVTAGEPVAVRRAHLGDGDRRGRRGSVAEAPAADATAPTRRRMPATATAAGAASASTGRTQVDFTIAVTAGDLDQVVAFLDALRAGPRLLGQIQTTVDADGNGLRRVAHSAHVRAAPGRMTR